MKQILSNVLLKIQALPLIFKIAIPVFVVLILVLLTTALLLKSQDTKSDMFTTEAADPNLLYSTILFSPEEVPLEPARTQAVPVILDLGENSAKRVSFSIKYTPESISLIDLIQVIDPTSPLSNSFTTESIEVSPETGTAKITLVLKDGAKEQIGRGVIAQFSFRVNSAYQGKLGFTIQDANIDSDNASGKLLSPQTNTLVVTTP